MRIELLDDLYQRTLNQLLDGEKQMVRMLPKVQKAVSDPEMASSFGRHTAETKKQIERLERMLGKKPAPRAAKAEAISGLLAELKAILDRRLNDPDVLDAALAEAATQIEGHEISAYACAHKYAKFLGRRTD